MDGGWRRGRIRFFYVVFMRTSFRCGSRNDGFGVELEFEDEF